MKLVFRSKGTKLETFHPDGRVKRVVSLKPNEFDWELLRHTQDEFVVKAGDTSGDPDMVFRRR